MELSYLVELQYVVQFIANIFSFFADLSKYKSYDVPEISKITTSEVVTLQTKYLKILILVVQLIRKKMSKNLTEKLK